MNQFVTQAIILARTDYGEADRILTVVTPQYGKLRVLAKGVRRVKSRLAGGIELFSVSEVTLIKGRSDIHTLVSTRLLTHYGRIVQNIERTMLGYDLIKQFNRLTEDETEPDYFALLQHTFAALDDHALDLGLIRLWFYAQVLRLNGHAPNLHTDTAGHRLSPEAAYDFALDSMAFTTVPPDHARFRAGHIKLLRLVFDNHTPQAVAGVQGTGPFVPAALALVDGMRRQVA